MRLNTCLQIILLTGAVGIAAPSDAQPGPTEQVAGRLGAIREGEAAVRRQPLDARPNRLGHFYGNNVRRLQHGTLCVNCGKTDRPLARFLYLPR